MAVVNSINKFGTSLIQEALDEAVGSIDGNTVDQINAGGNTLINLADPVNSSDGATKYYVDTQCGLNVLKSGDTMSGNLNMSNNIVTGLPTSLSSLLNDSDAVSKKVMVDAATVLQNNSLQKVGDIMSGQLDMNSNKITNLLDPVNIQDASSKNYVDNQNNLKVSKSRDSMSGTLNMATNRIIGLPVAMTVASSDSDAVSKKILVIVAAGIQSNSLQRAGDFMNGQIDMNSNKIGNLADPSSGQDAVSKYYVDTALGGYLSKFGTTSQGDILLSIAADTVRNLGCNNINAGKMFNLYLGDNVNYIRYTPNSLVINSSAGILFTDNGNNIMHAGVSNSNFNVYFYQPVNMSLNKILNMADPTLNQDAATKKYADDNDNLRILKAGDTMSGTLNMSNLNITNLASPINGGDASNKSYVDSKLIKSSPGVIHQLGTDYNNRDGAIVTCSQDYNAQYRAWQIFAQGLANGTNEFAIVTNPTWPVIVQIQLANAVPIWQIAIRGRIGNSSSFTAWQLRGSVDGTTYVTLINSTQIISSGAGSATPIYLVPVSPVNTNAFKYFQLYFTAANGTNSPGLSYCQLYQYDSLY